MIETLSTGFELEFEGFAAPLRDTDAPTYVGKPLAARRTWKFRTDSSCGPGHLRGYEINSPVSASIDVLDAELSFLGRWMEMSAPVVNTRCGFHIHVGGLNDSVARAVLSFFAHYEDAFFALVPEHRRNNTYCRRLDSDVREGLVNSSQTASVEQLCDIWADRRLWLNAAAFRKHGTLELRLPEGTVDVHQIRGWIHLFLACCEGVVTKVQQNGKSKHNAHLSKSTFLPIKIHDMLVAAGLYGAQLKRKIGWGNGVQARKFVADRFAELHGYSYRTRLDAWLREKRVAPLPMSA